MTQPRLPFHDGHSIPQFGFGLWQVPEEGAPGAVAAAAAAGYRLFDGAAIYGNEAGMGQGLRDSGVPRDDLFVTTKVWNTAQGFDSTLRAAEASLERLGLDHVDLLLIHWPCPRKALFVETWRALIRLRDEGRVTSIGVSNFNAAQIDRLTEETGVTPVLNQVEINPRNPQPDLQARMTARGIVTQSWTPLGNGLSFDAAPVRAAAARTGLTPAGVILRWHVQRGLSVIPRSTDPGRIAANVAVLDGPDLTGAEMAAITALGTGERCGPHPDDFE
ncbi:MAG: 2,5-diketo-D-gluconate reductase A [Rhodobacteraceae bacterium HLUCCA08]|nr:MAG: 2,5-diketo-D-gluconate reductase A [Rhodobacteraceae bacterium HLUCCA08]